jgi:type I restriction enzyme R subunit
LIDQYGYEESKADGATLPIRHIGRLPQLFVEGEESIDVLFDRIIGAEPNMTPELKERLKKEYVTKSRIAEAPERIKKIVLDIIEHYTNWIEPNGYKAMIVASSREAAVLYKRELDRLRAPPSKIVMDQKIGDTGKDGKTWDEYNLTDTQKRHVEDNFITTDDPTKILIVVDMLLTGFDAPIVKVLYLDKSLKEHTLLQAIARVNRPYDKNKTEGLIVDYYGITKNMEKAFEIFNPDDITGAWESDDEQLVILKACHSDVMQYMMGLNIEDLEQVTVAFEPADKRDKFEESFKRFSKVLNSQLYKKESAQYVPDFKTLAKIRNHLRNVYDDPQFSTRKYAPLIQKIIDDAIRASGVIPIGDEREISAENFLKVLDKTKSTRARTAMLKNKVQQVIEENKFHDPIYYEKLSELLQRLILEEQNRVKSEASELEFEQDLKAIYTKATSREDERKKLGFERDVEFTIYGIIQENKDDKDNSIKITNQLSKKLLPETEIVEWYNKPSIKRKLQEVIYDTLDSNNIPEDDIEKISENILKILNRENV